MNAKFTLIVICLHYQYAIMVSYMLRPYVFVGREMHMTLNMCPYKMQLVRVWDI